LVSTWLVESESIPGKILIMYVGIDSEVILRICTSKSGNPNQRGKRLTGLTGPESIFNTEIQNLYVESQ